MVSRLHKKHNLKAQTVLPKNITIVRNTLQTTQQMIHPVQSTGYPHIKISKFKHTGTCVRTHHRCSRHLLHRLHGTVWVPGTRGTCVPPLRSCSKTWFKSCGILLGMLCLFAFVCLLHAKNSGLFLFWFYFSAALLLFHLLKPQRSPASAAATLGKDVSCVHLAKRIPQYAEALYVLSVEWGTHVYNRATIWAKEKKLVRPKPKSRLTTKMTQYQRELFQPKRVLGERGSVVGKIRLSTHKAC